MPSGQRMLALLLAAVGWAAIAAADPAEPLPKYVTDWWQWPPGALEAPLPAGVQASAGGAADVVNASASGRLAAGGISDLWGKRGELWTPAGPLMDFSFAGYRQGAPLPNPPVTITFSRFKKGGASDTAALLAALAWAHKQPHDKWVVIGLPAGTIRLDRQLTITRPRLILRGAGSRATTLRIDRPLRDTPGVPRPPGKWGYYNQEAFIMVTGRYLRDRAIANLVGKASRGNTRVRVDSAKRLRAGDTVALILSDKKGVLTRHLLNDRPLDPGTTSINRYMAVRFVVKVLAVSGTTVRLERPLPFDVRPEFLPQLLPNTATVYDVGIEGLKFQFPFDYYGGHHLEAGYNVLQFWEVTNCWARDIWGHNVDSGVFIHKSSAVQINDLRLTQTKPRNPKPKDYKFGDGHWGVHNGGSCDVLVDRFKIEPHMLHHVGSDAFGMYAVFSNGTMTDGNLELHRALSHALFTDINAGRASRALESGGPSRSGPNTQAWMVAWGIRSAKPMAPPAANGVPAGDCRFGPDLTLVGMTLSTKKMCSWWRYEAGTVKPANLYRAQLARRLAAKAATAA